MKQNLNKEYLLKLCKFQGIKINEYLDEDELNKEYLRIKAKELNKYEDEL